MSTPAARLAPGGAAPADSGGALAMQKGSRASHSGHMQCQRSVYGCAHTRPHTCPWYAAPPPPPPSCEPPAAGGSRRRSQCHGLAGRTPSCAGDPVPLCLQGDMDRGTMAQSYRKRTAAGLRSHDQAPTTACHQSPGNPSLQPPAQARPPNQSILHSPKLLQIPTRTLKLHVRLRQVPEALHHVFSQMLFCRLCRCDRHPAPRRGTQAHSAAPSHAQPGQSREPSRVHSWYRLIIDATL